MDIREGSYSPGVDMDEGESHGRWGGRRQPKSEESVQKRDRGSCYPLGSCEKKKRKTGEIEEMGENGEGSKEKCGIKEK